MTLPPGIHAIPAHITYFPEMDQGSEDWLAARRAENPRRRTIRSDLLPAAGFVSFCAAVLFVIPFFQP